MGDQIIEKKVIVARSGIYEYSAADIQAMTGKPIIEKYRQKDIFSVYRPAVVLAAAKDLFVRLPVILEHPPIHGFLLGDVTPENYSQLAVGWVGDSVDVIWNESDKEAFIVADIILADRQALEAYESGIREVSPGYQCELKWSDGIDSMGNNYELIMTNIVAVNHLAIVTMGRGGENVKILDRSSDSFYTVLDGFIKSKESYAGLKNRLLSFLAKIPDSKEKRLLERYTMDLEALYSVPKKQADICIALLKDLYHDIRQRLTDNGGSDMFFSKKSATKQVQDLKKQVIDQKKSITEQKKPVSKKALDNRLVDEEIETPVDEDQPEQEITVESLPDDPSDLTEDQVKFILGAVIQQLKSQSADESSDEENDESDQEAVDGDMEKDEVFDEAEEADEKKEKAAKTGDSRRIFSSRDSISTGSKMNQSTEDLIKALWPSSQTKKWS